MSADPSAAPSAGARPAHTAILASAGTGKTFALTSRCLALIGAGVPPERILATTFTRLAAGEIRERILSRLAEASLDEAAAARLSEQVGRTPADALDAAAWRDRLVHLVRRVDRLNISTLDAFFGRLAAGFALELGGALSWEPADEQMLDHVRDQALTRLLHSSDREGMLQLIRARSAGLMERSVRRELRRAVDETHAAAIASDLPAWQQLHAFPPLEPARLRAAIEDLRAFAAPLTQAGRPNRHWEAGLRKAVDAVERGRWDDFLDLGLVRAAIREKKFDRLETGDELSFLVDPIVQHITSVVVGRLSERNAATWRLMRQYDDALRAAKSELGVLAFDDVPRMLLDASVADRLATLYYRLDSTLSHVMLDEFQDTSIIQWRLIRPLVDEVVSGEGAEASDLYEDETARAVAEAGRSFLCVGDVKQSLYGWRDAEPGLLPMIPRIWPQVHREKLVVNRRSSPVVIDVVNRAFGTLASNPAFEDHEDEFKDEVNRRAATEWQDLFDRHRAHKSAPGCVVLRAAPELEGSTSASARRRSVLNLAAERIAEIRREAPWATVGVLFRSKAPIARLRHILATRHGVAASEEGGNPLSDSARVGEILSLLTLADFPSHTAAAHHVTHSPVGAIVGLGPGSSRDEVRDAARLVRERLLHDGLAPTLARWAARLEAEASARDRDRLGALVTLASEYERRVGPRSVRTSPFVRFVESRRVEDPSAAPVRLMSIHASKGLEFDAVVLPDLDRTFASKPPGVLTQREAIEGPIIRATLAPKGREVMLDGMIEQLYGGWRANEIREEICVLYVAMTRAVHSLDLIIQPRRASKEMPLSMAGILRGAVQADAEAGTVLFEHGDPAWAAHASRERAEHGGEETPVASGGASDEATTGAGLGLDWSGRTRFQRVRTASERAFPAIATGRRGAGAIDPRRAGIAVHAWLAAIEWLDGWSMGNDALAALTPGEAGLTRAEIASLLARFRRALEGPRLRGVLLKPREGGAHTAHVELPYVLASARGPVSGRFDRVVVTRGSAAVVPSSPPASVSRSAGPRGSTFQPSLFDAVGERSGGDVASGAPDAEGVRRVQVHDFKVTLGRASIDERVHDGQMRAYERAAAILFGADPARVVASVVHVDLG